MKDCMPDAVWHACLPKLNREIEVGISNRFTYTFGSSSAFTRPVICSSRTCLLSFAKTSTLILAPTTQSNNCLSVGTLSLAYVLCVNLRRQGFVYTRSCKLAVLFGLATVSTLTYQHETASKEHALTVIER